MSISIRWEYGISPTLAQSPKPNCNPLSRYYGNVPFGQCWPTFAKCPNANFNSLGIRVDIYTPAQRWSYVKDPIVTVRLFVCNIRRWSNIGPMSYLEPTVILDNDGNMVFSTVKREYLAHYLF